MKINIKNIRIKSICATLFISLFLSCNSGVIEELEKKKTFADSLVNIGHSFQEIFTSFGNTIGDALGFSAVKSTDNRSAVGDHFKKIGDGLTATKNKLNELSSKISETKNSDTKGVENAIKGANDVFDKLITALTKLAGVTKATDKIGDAETGGAPKPALVDDIKIIITEIKEIIGTAIGSGVKIDIGKAGDPVTNDGSKAPAVLVGKGNNKADANAGPALAGGVAQADPWAMLDKIKDAKTGTVLAASNYDAGELATAVAGVGVNNVGAKTNADLAAAVALKAMTQGGKFSAQNSDEEGAVKGAATSAVNKVLGVLDEIIRKTVSKSLEKVREAIQGIQYSETTSETTEGKN
ncbi:variable large family protein (plasmid) [Borrelia coriaceae]|uniref:variable large family protein n=1 Tax=Borrelia coriaceae TaxID=144 RepID=UPI0004AEB374|nr:variable large family protein [Borrelia coriaceae]UPA17527.1 variable large family protein [Borrelia coriaceae]